MSDLGSLSTSLTTYYQTAIEQFQQNLFNKVDANSDGSVTKTELEQAVTANGGTSAAADALYAVLDPGATGSVSETQFAQNLPSLPFSDQIGAQLIADQSQRSIGGWGGGAGDQISQTLFAQIDANGDGAISKTELEQAVTVAGGTGAAADALYAQLDPNNAGSVSEQQFAQTLAQALPHTIIITIIARRVRTRETAPAPGTPSPRCSAAPAITQPRRRACSRRSTRTATARSPSPSSSRP